MQNLVDKCRSIVQYIGMATWEVTIPIAGHAYLTVEADSEDEAIEMAIEQCTLKDVDEWEALRQFNQGNICYCPRPWEAEAEEDKEC